MADGIVGEILVCDDGLESLVDGVEVGAEEVGLDLSKFVELDKTVLKNGLILLSEGLGNNTDHKGKELDIVLGVLALGNGQEVRESLESSQLNVELAHLERSLEDSAELVLELDEMIHDVAEKTIEDLEGGVDLSLILSLDELEKKVEKILPDGIILLLLHGTLDLDCDIADLMHVSLVGSIDSLECLKDDLLDGVTSSVTETLPEVTIVLLVGQVTSIHSLDGDISAKNDGSKSLLLHGDLSLSWVKSSGEQASVLVSLSLFGGVKLGFGSLTLFVVVAKDLSEDGTDAREIFRSEILHLKNCDVETKVKE